MPTPATLSSIPFPTGLINPGRIRSYLLRLPLFTRGVILAILFFWILELQTVWSVIQWGALIPQEIGLGTMYRLNTFPLIHMGFWHMLADTICLVPLLERFEAEWGTLNSVALFLGRKSFLVYNLWFQRQPLHVLTINKYSFGHNSCRFVYFRRNGYP